MHGGHCGGGFGHGGFGCGPGWGGGCYGPGWGWGPGFYGPPLLLGAGFAGGYYMGSRYYGGGYYGRPYGYYDEPYYRDRVVVVNNTRREYVSDGGGGGTASIAMVAAPAPNTAAVPKASVQHPSFQELKTVDFKDGIDTPKKYYVTVPADLEYEQVISVDLGGTLHSVAIPSHVRPGEKIIVIAPDAPIVAIGTSAR